MSFDLDEGHPDEWGTHLHTCAACWERKEHPPETAYYALHPDECEEDNAWLCKSCQKDEDAVLAEVRDEAS